MNLTIPFSLSDLGALLDSGSLEILDRENRIVLKMEEKATPILIKPYSKYSHFVLVPISLIRRGYTHVFLVPVAYPEGKEEEDRRQVEAGEFLKTLKKKEVRK